MAAAGTRFEPVGCALQSEGTTKVRSRSARADMAEPVPRRRGQRAPMASRVISMNCWPLRISVRPMFRNANRASRPIV